MNPSKKKDIKRRGRSSGKSSKELEDGHEWMASKKQEEKDPCDCPNAMCPGCWYPCETCGSDKCSTFCRSIKRDEPLEWKRSD